MAAAFRVCLSHPKPLPCFLLLACMAAMPIASVAAPPILNPSSSPLPASAPPLLTFLQHLQASALSTFASLDPSPVVDPKTYVDLPLRYSLDRTSAAFEALPRSPATGLVPPESLQRFLDDYFDDAGSDLVEHIPSDFEAEPLDFLPRLHDPTLRSWALKVHAIWLQLSRKVAANVENEPSQHTLLPLPYPLIVPGSRFREVYYWDAYWIIRGLIISKMLDTAKGMVENLLHLVQVYGFVINGSRSYYENRSQPPLLSAMVREVYAVTNDSRLLEKALPLLIQEHRYWTSDPKQVAVVDDKGRKHMLSRYYANWWRPRPESFTIDMHVGLAIENEKEREYLYHDIATAAESGWDFGSRWMRDQEHLSTLFTSSILPADLNAFLFQMEKNVAFLAKASGNKSIAKTFDDAARLRKLAIQSVFWNENMGQWLDYILESDSCQVHDNQIVYIWNEENQHKVTSASNFLPLWSGVFNAGDSSVVNVINALIQSGLVCPAGIATSLRETGQQWDFPNAWPPLQHMIIEGLLMYGSEKGRIVAGALAQKWIETNFKVYNESGHMLEKYDATVSGGMGGGGEYDLQTGFGWSNGVVLCLLDAFGHSTNVSNNLNHVV